MARVIAAALLACALVVQVQSQGSPEPCGINGQCQVRCYTGAFSGQAQTVQTSGFCNPSSSRNQCCSGPRPSWQWTSWSNCSGSSSCSQYRFQKCQAASREDAFVQDCPVLSGSMLEQQACPSSACFRLTEWTSWTPCSSRCATGARRRSRSCVDNIGIVLPALSCGVTDAQLQESKTCDGRCDAFGWSAWRVTSACNSNCLETVTRDCQFNGVAYPSNYCGDLAQDTRPCKSTPQCAQNTNRWSDWTVQGPCDVNTCLQQVTRECRSNTGVQSPTLCGATTSTRRRCSCATSMYGWSTNQWSSWSGCIGGAFQETRRRPCVTLASGVVVQDYFCTGSAPTENRQCTSYSWSTSQWSSWSGCTAGQTQETRRRLCVNSAGNFVSDAYCSGQPQTETRQCSTFYTWSTSQWSSWSGCTAGQQQQTRRRPCLNSAGATVGDYFCPGASPVETRPCPNSFSWSTSQWSSWSGCTAGQQQDTRRRPCVNSAGATVGDYFCPGASPVETRPCPNSYSWSTSQWSSWSACGAGQTQQTRRRLCVNSVGTTVPDYFCSGSPQLESRPCPSSYTWSTTQWTTWSGCVSGQLNETRRRPCVDTLGTTVANYLCSGSAAPVESRPCPNYYFWSTSQWTTWSGCSSGQQRETRRRPCLNYQGSQFADYLCPGSSPVETRNCPIHYAWSSTHWSSWSGCGAGQLQQTRRRPCEDNFGNTVQDSLCTGSPQTETGTCPRFYSWSTTQWTSWSGCSGGQTQETRRRPCVNYLGNTVSNSFCSGSSPVETRVCYPCTWSGQWTSWVGCSGQQHTRTRSRPCVNSTGSACPNNLCNGLTPVQSVACPNCAWSTTVWNPWSSCSAGLVQSTRRRPCVDAGGNSCHEFYCSGSSSVQYNNCGNSYTWAPWSIYGPCSAPCGQHGLKRRQKFCRDVSSNTVSDDLCSGSRPTESLTCVTDCTPWSTWGAWSTSCTFPSCRQTRARTCSSSQKCQGLKDETRACYADRCGFGYAEWSQWSTCDRTCRQYRSRTCLSYTSCSGLSQEVRSCETCPDVEVCGKYYYTEPRILGGNSTSYCRWPWMANVRVRTSTGSYKTLCGAVLIDHNTLVTSATCINKINTASNVRVVFNDRNALQTGENAERRFAISSANTQKHGSYSSTSGSNVFTRGNIGVIQLSTSVGYTSSCIQPVCLPDANTRFADTDNYIAGWGRTGSGSGTTSDSLKEAKVKVTSGLTCSVTLAFSGRTTRPLPDDLICSNYLANDGAISCEGDQGGMLVAKDTSGAWVLRGINVDNVCDVTKPNMFVDVTRYAAYLEARKAANN